MAEYIPNPRSIRLASLLVAYDKRPVVPAMFVHGSCVRHDGLDDAILEMVSSAYRRGSVGEVVINGISDAVCTAKTLAYPGADTWKHKLSVLGINPSLIPASPHTPAEVRNMIALASEKGWDSLIIAAFPHHLLRVMCQWVYVLKDVKSSIKVYARTMETVDWNMPAKKPLLGGGVVDGTLLDLAEDEITRLCQYADLDCFQMVGGKRIPASEALPEDKQLYTPNATLEELIAYYTWRDSN